MKKVIKLSLIASISCLLTNSYLMANITPNSIQNKDSTTFLKNKFHLDNNNLNKEFSGNTFIWKVNFKKYPLPKAFTSKSHGGDLPDKVAATDGVGTLLLYDVTTNKNKIDNSAYNKLMDSNTKNLSNNITLEDLLKSGQIKISNKDFLALNKFINMQQNNNPVNKNLITCGPGKGVNKQILSSWIDQYNLYNSPNKLLSTSEEQTKQKLKVEIENACTSNITDMSNLFYDKYYFNLPLNKWDTSNVTNMSHMFYSTGSFNQDISSWNVSKVNDMSYMFDSKDDEIMVFNNGGKPLNWNTSHVTNMEAMFKYAFKFNQDISSWDVSNVTNMSYMFEDAWAFNQNINNWNVSNVIDMSHMFEFYPLYDSENYRKYPIFNQPLNKWNVSKVRNMSHMFDKTPNFNQDISSWDVSNVTDMSYMFVGTYTLLGYYNYPVSLDLTSSTYRKIGSKYAYYYWTSFNNGGKPLTWGNKTHNVTNMKDMFYNAGSFNQDISSWDVSNVTDMSNMFQTYDVHTVGGSIGVYGKFNNGGQPLDWKNTSKVRNMSNMFNNDKNFNQDISSWDVSNVTSMDGMFAGTNSNGVKYYTTFNQDISNWKPINVKDMGYMFAWSQFDKNISNWNVPNVTYHIEFDFNSKLYNNKNYEPKFK